MTHKCLVLLSLCSLVAGLFPSPAIAQIKDIDRRVEVCAGGLGVSIEGRLRGRIGKAYEESDLVGDDFVLNQLGAIFQGTTAAERIELYKLYTDCLKSERQQGGTSNLGYSEPSQQEMLKAHSAQVSPLALQLLPITHFVKQGCTAVQSKGYECSYQIRAGGTGTPKLVTNIFAKIGSDWIMRVN